MGAKRCGLTWRFVNAFLRMMLELLSLNYWNSQWLITSSFASQRALLANSWGFSWLFLNLLFLKFTASFFTVRQSSQDLAEPAFPWFPCPGSLYKGEDHRLFPFMIPAIQKAELKEKFLYTLGWQAGPLQFNKMVLLQENDPLVNWLCSLQVMGKNPLTFWN